MSLAHALLDQVLQQVVYGSMTWLLGRTLRAAARYVCGCTGRCVSPTRKAGPASRVTPGQDPSTTRRIRPTVLTRLCLCPGYRRTRN